MSKHRFHLLTALCGLLGAGALFLSFYIDQGPPSGSTTAEIIVWAKQNATSVLLGAWFQGTGTLLSVIFAFALVHLTQADNRLSGQIAKMAGIAVLTVSLTEVVCYLSALSGAQQNDPVIVSTCLTLLSAVQHLYFIAPSLLLPLGFVVFGSRVLPQMFSYTAFGIGIGFEILGLVGLFIPFKIVTIVVPVLAELWILAAAIFLFRVDKSLVAERPVSDSIFS